MKRTVMLVAAMLVLVAADQRSAPSGTGVRYVYLVRHGWYAREAGRDERVGGALDSLGRAQARLVAERLAALPIRIDTLVTSDFTRARQTADIIGEALHVVPAVDSTIHECSPALGPGDPKSTRPPPEFERCDSRLRVAWQRYFRPADGRDTHDVLVCHGNVIRWFVARALAIDPSRWSAMDIGNASLTVISVRPTAARGSCSMATSGHLPVALQTWTGRGAGWSAAAPAAAASGGAAVDGAVSEGGSR
jgi:serine/threonine-protein phosphatase PGAM5